MLEFSDMSFTYDKKTPVLEKLSFSIPGEKITCLIGPNACGKSTLLRLAAGLLRPTAGSIAVSGHDLGVLPPKERAKRISFFPQWRTVPDITVFDLAAHGRYPHLSRRHVLSQKDRDIIENALRLTGAWEFSHRRLTSLSGGQRQRACLAMTVAQDTPLILLDEPTAYLDIRVQYELMALLRTLADGGKTVVMVLHDLPLALERSDYALLLADGKLQCCGAPREIAQSGAVDKVFGIALKKNKYGYTALPLI
ncbi:MAG: ABC transporter ATP-binding protein [Oscillospiraceae bacterium]|jgi:iron complex transport system ATP-binding protein|nr:ABC transporter ATP-binding protein [Oscillospiraceae bacterium]